MKSSQGDQTLTPQKNNLPLNKTPMSQQTGKAASEGGSGRGFWSGGFFRLPTLPTFAEVRRAGTWPPPDNRWRTLHTPSSVWEPGKAPAAALQPAGPALVKRATKRRRYWKPSAKVLKKAKREAQRRQKRQDQEQEKGEPSKSAASDSSAAAYTVVDAFTNSDSASQATAEEQSPQVKRETTSDDDDASEDDEEVSRKTSALITGLRLNGAINLKTAELVALLQDDSAKDSTICRLLASAFELAEEAEAYSETYEGNTLEANQIASSLLELQSHVQRVYQPEPCTCRQAGRGRRESARHEPREDGEDE